MTVRQIKRSFSFLLGPLLFVFIYWFLAPAGLSDQGRAVLACTVWIAAWWITEPIPIPVTGLLPIVLLPLSGGLDSRTTTSAYGDSTVFLFLGGFILALAMEQWNLHRRIALSIIVAIGTNTRGIVLGFMAATAFLSMWISNTATVMMMMPIGMAVILQLQNLATPAVAAATVPAASRFGKALMLGMAYAASIGGLATLVGTPTNTIFAAIVRQLFGVEISFAGWMLFAVPPVVLLFLLCWAYLVWVAFPLGQGAVSGGAAEIQQEKAALGPIGPEEKRVLVVFGLTALAWISRSFLLNPFLPALDDTIIAVAGAAVLFALPAPSQPGRRILHWEAAARLPWGILLLFGGGLAIAAGFRESGLAPWIGSQLTVFSTLGFLLLLLLVTAFVNFLTELTSNVATATMLLPILASLAEAIGVHPYGLMIAGVLAASCAFMLPVATPPNAIVFGSGYLRMGDMIRAGFWLNLLSILVIALAVYYWLPVAWGLDLLGPMSE